MAVRLGYRNALAGRRRFGLHEFVCLERTATGIVFGLAGRFWRADFGLHPLRNADEFHAFTTPGTARLVMGFEVSARPSGGGHTLHTETRVQCVDMRSRCLFTPYWLAIGLGSGFIRRRFLGHIRDVAEAATAG